MSDDIKKKQLEILSLEGELHECQCKAEAFELQDYLISAYSQYASMLCAEIERMKEYYE